MPSMNGEMSEEELLQERESTVDRLCTVCGHDDDGRHLTPLRVVLVGKHGAGKSSFINGVAAALSGERWREHAYTGNLGRGAPVTIVNQRFPKCCSEDRERFGAVLLPTLIDVAGLLDEEDDKLEELLRLLFYGHVQEDEPLMRVYEDCRIRTREEIRVKYRDTFPHMRVDRVIFVASADPDDPLPQRLMACVLRAARPAHYRAERRAVPIFGVLTKKDRVDPQSPDFQEKKDAFLRGLGLNHARYLLCSNYCDDLDPDGSRTRRLIPGLDVPLLRFMVQVSDRALKVIREEEVLPGCDIPDNRHHANMGERNAAARVGLQAVLVGLISFQPIIGFITAVVAFIVAIFRHFTGREGGNVSVFFTTYDDDGMALIRGGNVSVFFTTYDDDGMALIRGGNVSVFFTTYDDDGMALIRGGNVSVFFTTYDDDGMALIRGGNVSVFFTTYDDDGMALIRGGNVSVFFTTYDDDGMALIRGGNVSVFFTTYDDDGMALIRGGNVSVFFTTYDDDGSGVAPRRADLRLDRVRALGKSDLRLDRVRALGRADLRLDRVRALGRADLRLDRVRADLRLDRVRALGKADLRLDRVRALGRADLRLDRVRALGRADLRLDRVRADLRLDTIRALGRADLRLDRVRALGRADLRLNNRLTLTTPQLSVGENTDLQTSPLRLKEPDHCL
ncbi:hypothetical protein ACOMHN_041543 [Nucella lapillus]